MTYSRHLFQHLRFTIGQNIRRLRSERQMLLRELAELSGVEEDQIDRYELAKGNLRLDFLLRIACALGARVEALLR